VITKKFNKSIRPTGPLSTVNEIVEKRQRLELFNVRGKLAIENNEKVIHATCLLQLQPVSLARILLWRCNLKGTQYLVSARLVLTKYGGQKSSERENEDASANAEAFCLGFTSTIC